MNFLSWFSALSLILTIAKSWPNESIFNPIATVNTTTLAPGKLALTRAPLGNLNSSFLTSSLNIGVFDRVEIGTAPLFYALKEHKQNYNFKVLVYDGEIAKWSLNGGNLVFTTEHEIDGEVERPNVEMHFTQLAVNIHIPNSRFKVGLSAASSCGHIKSNNVWVRIYGFRCEDETGFDLQYQYKENLWITLGQGRNREAGLTPYESVVNGVGAAVTMLRKNQFISRPSLGYYVQDNGQNLFFLTTTFYEM